ncbi:MAG: hypothetical protein LUD48_03340 [Prevotella sp.]|nr:hypothetical protein [Prevotella sp.]
MKKLNLLKWGFLCLFCALTTVVGATKYDCYWANSTAVQSTDDFFTITDGSVKTGDTYGTVTYNNTTYDTCLQFESSTSISFNTTEANMTMTLIFSSKDTNHNMRIDDKNDSSAKQTATAVYDTDGTTVLYYELTCTFETAGTHTIYKADKVYLFYISVESSSSDGTEDGTVDNSGSGTDDGDDTVTTIGSFTECYFTDSSTKEGTNNDLILINNSNSNYSKDKGTGTYNENEYTYCLKMESSTTISFTTTENMTLTLVFGDSYTGSSSEVIINDDTVSPETGTNIYTTTLAAGDYTIKKGSNSSTFLFYISLSPITDQDDNNGDSTGNETTSLSIAVSPNAQSEEDTMSEFSEITVSIEGTDILLDNDKLSDFSIYQMGQGILETTISSTSKEESNGSTIYTLTLSETLADAGAAYTYTIPAGLFYTESGSANVETTGKVYIQEGGLNVLDLTFDPASGSTVSGSLSSIMVSCDEQYYLAAGSNDFTIYKDGELITDVSADAEYGDEEYEYVITFDPALTAGSYSIVIGAGMFTASDDSYTDVATNNEITLSYTVTASDENNEGDTEEVSNEGCLYSTSFTEWPTIDRTADGTQNAVTTDITNEDLIFTFFGVGVDPTGEQTKFTPETSTGYMVTAKYRAEEDVTEDDGTEFTEGSPYVLTSALNSITKIIFTQGATGNSRGIKISVKGVDEDGNADDDWVVLYNQYIDKSENAISTSGNGKAATDTVEVNRTNCQILFESMENTQNAYITDLYIYGDTTVVPTTGSSPYSLSVAEDGTTVNSLSTITVQIDNPGDDDYIQVDWDEVDISDIQVYSLDEDGEIDDVAAVADDFDLIEEGDEEEGTLHTVGYTFTLNETIKTAGTYMIYIPAIFQCGDDGTLSDAITATVYVSSTDGINSVSLHATANDRFYNLSGQRVTSPSRGIYILNGKKVLVK